ncbi:hypothetical protein MMC13_007251 [Lambiella insularis]|nr:hypothetical protein [Lambiella insularis]
MPPRRLIRRQPLADRIRAYLDPLDFLLWISEQFDSEDIDALQQARGTPIGLGLNLIMLLARANSGGGGRRVVDDVFGEEPRGRGWLGCFAAFLVHFLSLLAFVNAAYTFYRRKHYRLFENSIEDAPSTPSARRVRVDSSPMSSSPLRFLTNILGSITAEARAYPDASRDVWEISVWDPIPLCLKMFCLFSPGHVLVYWFFLPVSSQDPRPSTTVVTTIALIAVLSVQLTVLQGNYSQQSKDSSLIHKEVMNEYDTKYVHPLAHPLVRDVGTQVSGFRHSFDTESPDENHGESVDTYMPVIVANRGYRTKPNPNYIDHVDPQGAHRRATTPLRTRPNGVISSFQTPAHLRDDSSPIQPRTAVRQSQMTANVGAGTGDGGSLGVYSHAHSPLKKSASTHFIGRRGERERGSSPLKRESSPVKRTSVTECMNGLPNNLRWPQLQGRPARRESGRF